MYITYHAYKRTIRNENRDRIPEIRICAPKIASRFICTMADFTLDIKKEKKEFKFENSEMYSNISDSVYNDFEIKKFIVTGPLMSKKYVVIRNPLERLKSALAQLFFVDSKFSSFNSFEEVENILLKIMKTDTHLSWYHNDVIDFLNTSFSKNIVLEDLSKVSWHNTNHMSSNKHLYDKVDKLLEWLYAKNHSEVNSYLNNYIDSETNAYVELINSYKILRNE